MTGILILILMLAGAVVWVAGKPPAVFVVRIRAGEPRTERGKVTSAFLATVEELCAQFNIESGEIRGIARGRRIALWFPRQIPPAFRQRLRNWWAVSGWPAPPMRR